MRKFDKRKMERLVWKAVQVVIDLMDLDRCIQNKIEEMRG